MRYFICLRISVIVSILAGTLAAGRAFAEDGPHWLVQTSVHTRHFSANPEHDNHQRLFNVEYQRTDHWVVGGASFDNSFGQPSQYVYAGKLWRPLESAPLIHLKVTGGLIHGYKDRFRDKIPFNSSGFAPAVIPAVGLSGKHVSGEVAFFGVAGAMVTVGVLF